MGGGADHRRHSGYVRLVTSADVPRGRHRLAEPVRRHSLLPRSAGVVAATVGAVLVFGVQPDPAVPAPRPHPDAPGRAVSALEPVIPSPREEAAARFRPHAVPVTGASVAGAHLQATVRLEPARATTADG
jgi:hypothetical protein